MDLAFLKPILLSGAMLLFAGGAIASPANTGDKRNYALAGIATQSSDYASRTAERAIDGRTDQNYNFDSVTHTNNEIEPWWQVDLRTSKNLKEIKIYFRNDCCEERNSNFNVYLSNFDMSEMTVTELNNHNGVRSISYSDNTNDIVSQAVSENYQYVMVKKPDNGYLSLAEVEIFGDETLPPLPVKEFLDEHRYGAFLHYNMSTYDYRQWADPFVPVSNFSPTNLDTRQWANIVKEAGMTYAVLTAKHHDGFSLWDTKYTDHNSLNSPCDCDVVAEYMESFREVGVTPAIYFSIWDRRDPKINTTSTAPRPEGVDTSNGLTVINWTKRTQDPLFIKNQLRELLTEYGEVPLLWFDAWGQIASYDYVPYQDLRDFIRHISPSTIIVNNDKEYSNDTADLTSLETLADGLDPEFIHVKGFNTMYSGISAGNWFSFNASGGPKDPYFLAKILYETTLTPNGTFLLNLPIVQAGTMPEFIREHMKDINEIKDELVFINQKIPGNNIAFGKTTSQSSTFGGLVSNKAVDGDYSGENQYLVNQEYVSRGSLQHTQTEDQPWWSVDLESTHHVDEIRVWNRTDCCTDRLNKIAVHWSDSPIDYSLWDSTGNLQAIENIALLDKSESGRVLSSRVNGNARYVKVQSADYGVLNTAEIEVLQYSRNLTVNGTATQSSTQYGGSAQRAIDQNVDGNYHNGSVTHTANELNPWWEIDLGAQEAFTNITLLNRTDCCFRRLQDVYVFVSDTSMQGKTLEQLKNDPNITQYSRDAVGKSWNISSILNGRYIRVQIEGQGILSLAEVIVLKAPDVSNNLALNQNASQSSTLVGGYAEKAVDGVVGKYFGTGTITHTQSEAEPWWSVDLGNTQAINKITIHSRTDCCLTRTNDVYIMLYDDLPDTTASLSQNINASKHVIKVNVISDVAEVLIPTVSARHVLIRKENTGVLSFAEVEIE
ncbi:galactose-binding domain-containing protein [Vibrio penaeicida]|uniref:alpha-L-fucosidase n=1 Tax=Vibrio penaeicida TaxID=104609 RepID=A0AAV5NUN3_9VIBR|nr:discoidin domain-containing protein [Vibrio penaeicida]GLQ74165.1 hypothetical protein GCM10007932_35260 [Vibrio penaeicida]